MAIKIKFPFSFFCYLGTLFIVCLFITSCTQLKQKEIIKKINIPKDANWVTISPNGLWISYIQRKITFDNEKEVPDKLFILDIRKNMKKLVGNFWIDQIVWTRDASQLLIMGVLDKDKKAEPEPAQPPYPSLTINVSHSYFYNPPKNQLIKLAVISDEGGPSLSELKMKYKENKYYFLAPHFVAFPYSDSIFVVSEAGVGPGLKSFFVDVKEKREKIIPFDSKKGHIIDIIFSKDGSSIVLSASPPGEDSHGSLGLWIYRIGDKSVTRLRNTRKNGMVTFPLTISDNNRWLFYYFFPNISVRPKEETEKLRSLYVFNLDKMQNYETRLKLSLEDTSNIVWQSDNDRFLVLRGRAIYKYSLKEIL